MKTLKPAIYSGKVTHSRIRPRTHFLSYNVFSLLLDVNNLHSLNVNYKLLSYNRFNLFSIFDKDHGNQKNIKEWVVSELRNIGENDSTHQIFMLCYPRILGYVFNPLTVFYCYRKSGALGALVYEVRNTWGERHSYIMIVENQNGNIISHSCKKKFYVSPFVQESCLYKFKIRLPDDKVRIIIDESDENGPFLNATFEGLRSQLSDKHLVKMFFLYPLMTIKIILGIHYEAVKLFAKRFPIYKHIPKLEENTRTVKVIKDAKINRERN
jgi:uncharacterized protein